MVNLCIVAGAQFESEPGNLPDLGRDIGGFALHGDHFAPVDDEVLYIDLPDLESVDIHVMAHHAIDPSASRKDRNDLLRKGGRSTQRG